MLPIFIRPPEYLLDGIPVFVMNQSYATSFGEQWIRFAKTQLDSHNGSSITANRAKRMLGAEFSNLNNKQVLEAGCGSGRFTEILLQKGSFVTAFDISIAVLANKLNNGQNERLSLFQASITDLPLEKEFFDLVFSPGVVQHTPNPKETIRSLFSQVKPGGCLVFDQYRLNLSTCLRTAWIVRLFARKLNAHSGMSFTNKLVDFWLPIHRKLANKPLLEMFLFRISPITSFYSSYPNLAEHHQVEWSRLNTHDNLTDYYKRLTTPKKLLKLLENLGAVEIEIRKMPYTIEVRCYKPESDSLNKTRIKHRIIRNVGRNVDSG